jgi:LysM repeat protein
VHNYVIRWGDTLFSISRRYHTTVNALRRANCITGDLIFAGRRLWVPGVDPVVTSTPAGQMPAAQPGRPGVNPTTVVAADPCSNPIACVTSLRYGLAVPGPFWVDGTANVPNFARYEIDVRRDGTSVWQHQGTYTIPIVSGHLARIEPDRFGSGAFWIRLTVVDQTGNYPPRCAILVYFP